MISLLKTMAMVVWGALSKLLPSWQRLTDDDYAAELCILDRESSALVPSVLRALNASDLEPSKWAYRVLKFGATVASTPWDRLERTRTLTVLVARWRHARLRELVRQQQEEHLHSPDVRRLLRAPGSGMGNLLKTVFGKCFYEGYLEQTLFDHQSEWFEAHKRGDLKLAKWINIRCNLLLLWTVIALLPIEQLRGWVFGSGAKTTQNNKPAGH